MIAKHTLASAPGGVPLLGHFLVGLPELVCGAPARSQNLLPFAQFRRSPYFEPTC
jgi:hypothetical protein